MKQKICLALLVLMLLVTIPIRMFELAEGIDPETGFYNAIDGPVIILRAVLIAGCVSIAILALTDLHYYEDAFEERSRSVGTATFLVGVMVLFISALEAYNQLFRSPPDLMLSLGILAGIAAVVSFVLVSADIFANKKPNILALLCLFGSLFLFLLSPADKFSLLIRFLGVASGLSFILVSVEIFANGRPQGVLSALLLIILLWSILRAIETFLSYQTVATIPQHLLHILALLAAPLFFLGHARVFANARAILGQKQSVVWGAVGGILGLVYAIPTILHSAAQGEMFSVLFSPLLMEAALSLYMLVFAGKILLINADN